MAGWLAGVPVPFMIMAAPSWEWIVAANVLLGINQGLAWSMTVIMKIDLVGPRGRGLAVGLNEFAGYLAVGVAAWAGEASDDALAEARFIAALNAALELRTATPDLAEGVRDVVASRSLA